MTIRPATSKDFLAIKKLISRYPKQLFQKNLPRASEFIVALNGNGQIIGCCALQIYSKRFAEIRSLAVAKKYQGRGIATKLIRQCLARAKQKKIYEVLSITNALRLFNHFGFKTFNKQKYALLKILTPWD